jgi:O-antigen/teichoic acid export membrane protein
MTIYAGSEMMGNYFSAAYFSVLLTFITLPIATVLFPAFSKLNAETEPELVKTVFASSVKYTSILLVPATMALIALSTPLLGTLFPEGGILNSLFVPTAALKFPYAPQFLALSTLVYLFVLLGSITLGTFQTGIGKTNQVMKQGIVSLIVGLPLAWFMVGYFSSIGGASFAIIGGILGTLIATIPTMAWGLYWCWKNYKVKADFGVSAKIFVASLIASGITYLFVAFVILPYVFLLVGGFAIFLIVYLIAAPLLGGINATDIENFKSMFSSLGFISKILAIPLVFMKKMCKSDNSQKVLAIPSDS